MAQMKRAWTMTAMLAVASASASAAASASEAAATQAQPEAAGGDAAARARMVQGDARGALLLMRAHVAAHPGDRAARLDLVRYLTWSGDYAAADAVLRADADAVASTEGRALQANLLAWGGRLQQAGDINGALLAAEPEAFMPNYNQAVITRQTMQPLSAQPYVDTVARLQPGSRDARDLARGTWVRTSASVALEFQQRDDSDDIQARWTGLRAQLPIGERLRLVGELGGAEHSAPVGSPYAPIGGGTSLDETRALAGLRFASSESVEWSAMLGQSRLEGDAESVWRAGVAWRASDTWRLGARVDRDRVAISPRALSLGITRVGGGLELRWNPDLAWTGDLSWRQDRYSDDNQRAEVELALRRAVLRRPKFMLDLGGAVQHLHYDHDPANGYYAPDNYRRYALTAVAYLGFSDDVGLSLQGGLGRQRDENFSGWRRANDFSAELVAGIFSPWEFRIRAAWSERVQNAGAYDGTHVGLTLTHRFR